MKYVVEYHGVVIVEAPDRGKAEELGRSVSQCYAVTVATPASSTDLIGWYPPFLGE